MCHGWDDGQDRGDREEHAAGKDSDDRWTKTVGKT
jgi:hypothetical protein